MQKGMEFDQELADLWGWLVGGQVEKKEDYLLHLISPPILVGIQCPRCQCLLCIPEDYSGSAWQLQQPPIRIRQDQYQLNASKPYMV